MNYDCNGSDAKNSKREADKRQMYIQARHVEHRCLSMTKPLRPGADHAGVLASVTVEAFRFVRFASAYIPLKYFAVYKPMRELLLSFESYSNKTYLKSNRTWIHSTL